MSWDHGTFQPWMNVTASFVRFGVQGYPQLPLPSEACVSLCAEGHRAVPILILD